MKQVVFTAEDFERLERAMDFCRELHNSLDREKTETKPRPSEGK